MRIISERTLSDFAKKHPDSKSPLERGVSIIKTLKLSNLNQINDFFGSADILPNNRIIFNIGGNKYRLVTRIHVTKPGKQDVIYTIWIGTHSDYDKIDAATV